jgi:hypothetical protein
MKLELIIRPEAEADIAEAFDWYETRVPGLGSEFVLVLDALSIQSSEIISFIQQCIKLFVGHSPEDFPMQFSSSPKRLWLWFFLYSMSSAAPEYGWEESKGFEQTNPADGVPPPLNRSVGP